jgi:undecaprenyl-diphosphatase
MFRGANSCDAAGMLENASKGVNRLVSSDPKIDEVRAAHPRGVSSPARKFELSHLGLAAVICFALVALGLLTQAALEGGIRHLDETLLLSLRVAGDHSDPIGPKWFEELVRDVSALGSTFVLTLAVIVVAGYLLVIRAPAKAAFLIAAVTLGTLLNRVIKIAVGRPRPDLVAHATYVSNESFPSGHAANSAIVYLTLGMLLARVEASYATKVYVFAVCAVLTIMIGLSRIYLGVHWPSDVAAGWLLGTTWALLSWCALIWLQPTGTRA